MNVKSSHTLENKGNGTNQNVPFENPPPPIWAAALKEAVCALVAAAVVLAAIYTLTFERIHPEFSRFMGRDARPLTAFGKDFLPASVGKGQRRGQDFVVEDFNGDEAIIVLPRAFDAEDYPFIEVNLSGFTRYSKAKILWQRAGESQTHALEFNRSGDKVTQITMVYGGDNYSGRINSIGLLFYDGPELAFKNNNDMDITLTSVAFLPFSEGRVAEQIYADWTNPPVRQHSSINYVRGAHKNAILFPNAVINIWILASLVILAARLTICPGSDIGSRKGTFFRTVMCILLLSWVSNEFLTWQWRVEELVNSHERYMGRSYSEKVRSSDLRCSMFPENCASYLLPYF